MPEKMAILFQNDAENADLKKKSINNNISIFKFIHRKIGSEK